MKFISESTEEFIAEGKKVSGFKFFDLVHGLIYAKYIYIYIATGTGQNHLSKAIKPIIAFIAFLCNPIKKFINQISPPKNSIQFADTYHGKVVPIGAAKQLVSVQQEIQLVNLEHVIPYKKARDLILLEPTHIAVIDCPCRASRENPCLPLDVCIVIGEPFVGMILENYPKRARQISQTEAFIILEEEEARGHVHHAFFKDAMLGRFYAICNCCSCCCGAMQAQRHGTPMLASSGYLAVVDETLCIGCAACVAICQFNTISIPDIIAVVDDKNCMGCGICVSHCHQEAIRLEKNPLFSAPLELDELMKMAVATN